jgi:alpha-D-ribose 1-methylphosphonate 5-triphosphate synthase subunit PhnL
MAAVLKISGVSKTFVLHLRGGMTLPVVRDVEFVAHAGECVALTGPSGVGKSSILKIIFGNYRCDRGSVLVYDKSERHDMAVADPRRVIALRTHTIAYVSQFLRAVPRVAAIDIVAEPQRVRGAPYDLAIRQAGDLLARLRLPERLWHLPPATFSGGEQQRVNIARGLIGDHPLLLLDEPTASLDAANGALVVDLINERKRRGTAIVAIVHDAELRDAIADRVVNVGAFAAAA